LNWKTVLVVLIGFVGLIVFLYWGLNTAERGIHELLAADETPIPVFRFILEEKGVSILFAGRSYFLDCHRCLDFFSVLFPGTM